MRVRGGGAGYVCAQMSKDRGSGSSSGRKDQTINNNLSKLSKGRLCQLFARTRSASESLSLSLSHLLALLLSRSLAALFVTRASFTAHLAAQQQKQQTLALALAHLAYAQFLLLFARLGTNNNNNKRQLTGDMCPHHLAVISS